MQNPHKRDRGETGALETSEESGEGQVLGTSCLG
jgi:hypothetical protein